MTNIIAQAAKNLPGHWHKGSYGDGKGNFCAYGHVANAAGLTLYEMSEGLSYTPELERATDILNRLSGEMFPDRATQPFIAEFNDHLDTTEEDAVSLLEKAAVEWDEHIG